MGICVRHLPTLGCHGAKIINLGCSQASYLSSPAKENPVMTNPISPFLPPLNEEALSSWEIGYYAESNKNRGTENHGGWDGGGGWWRETLKPQKEIDDRKQGKEKSIVRASELLRIQEYMSYMVRKPTKGGPLSPGGPATYS